MGFRNHRFAGIVLAAAILIGTGPAAASPDEAGPNAAPQVSGPQVSETQSIHQELERLAAELKAHSDRMIGAAAQAAQRAIEDNKDVVTDAKSQWAAQLETFRALLNDQKANLDIMSEDAVAKLDTWTQAAKEQWAEMHQSALQALDLLQQWLDQQSASEEPIPV